MNPRIKVLLERKQTIAKEINRLVTLQRNLTEEIKGLEKSEKKEDLLGKGS